jgi:hypothetical protein
MPNINKAVKIIAGIIVAGLVIALLSAVAIAANKNLEPCFSFVCVGNIPILFERSFDIVAWTMEIAASTAVIFGLYISVATFVSSEEAKKNTQIQEHYQSYIKLANSSSIKTILPDQRTCISDIYENCYNTEAPPVKLSEKYKNTIKEISNLIDESNALLDPQNGKFDKATYGKKLYHLFEKLGIKLKLKRNEDIEAHEEIIFRLLDRMSEAEPQANIYLLEKTRKYHFR